MPFKTILVSLNHASRKGALISASIALAAKHNAHLIGLYVVPKLRIHAAIAEAASLTAIDPVRVFFEERATATERAFNEAVSMAGIEAEWRKAESSTVNISDGVVEHGFQAGVIIVSQKDEAANDGLEGDFCERIVMESGRPVLLIPLSGDFDHIGESVIVGWNATRESARAIFDALTGRFREALPSPRPAGPVPDPFRHRARLRQRPSWHPSPSSRTSSDSCADPGPRCLKSKSC